MNVCGKNILINGRLVRIASPELDYYECLNDPESIIDELRGCGIRVDLFTFMQSIAQTTPNYNYPMEWDNQAVLPVSSFDHWWNSQINSTTRNRARQAEKKGVQLKEVSFDNKLVEGMWEVYNESPLRQGKPNAHYGKDIQTIHDMEATFLDRSIFVGAFLEGKLIGFVKLVTDENLTQANLMNIVSMVKHRDKAPTNALIAESVRSCAKRGIQYLAYQKFVYGNKQPDSLTNFKEVNGFKRVNLSRFYVPLTPTGRLALSLGLHHRLVDRLPASVVDKLRYLRTAWYNRRIRQSAGVAPTVIV